MATKHITDIQVLRAYAEARLSRDIERSTPSHAGNRITWPEDLLQRWTGQPKKVCFSAMQRAHRRGYTDYGVSLRAGWITPEGHALIGAHFVQTAATASQAAHISTQMNDQQIEQEIQAKGLTAARVTPADIEANVIDETYFTAEQGYRAAMQEQHPDLAEMGNTFPHSGLRLLTFCVLTLRNGFTVTGESACASPENFDAELGKKIARQAAVNKIWPLMGYELRSKLASSPAS